MRYYSANYMGLHLSDWSCSYGHRRTSTDAKQFQHNIRREKEQRRGERDRRKRERERERDVSLLVCVFFSFPIAWAAAAARRSRWPRSPPPKGMCRRRRRTSPRVKCTTKCVRVRVCVNVCLWYVPKGTGLESGLMLWSILYSEHVWAAVTGNTASVYIVPRDKWKKCVCVCIYFFFFHARPSQCRTSTTVIYLSL